MLSRHLDNSVSMCRGGASSVLCSFAMPAPPGLCGGALTGTNGVHGRNVRVTIGTVPMQAGSFR